MPDPRRTPKKKQDEEEPEPEVNPTPYPGGGTVDFLFKANELLQGFQNLNNTLGSGLGSTTTKPFLSGGANAPETKQIGTIRPYDPSVAPPSSPAYKAWREGRMQKGRGKGGRR